MPDSGENAGETGIPNSGSAAFAPLEAWSQWLRNNMGTMSASPGSNGGGGGGGTRRGHTQRPVDVGHGEAVGQPHEQHHTDRLDGDLQGAADPPHAPDVRPAAN